MNSIHDMGGMEGFGPINPELNDHCFHEDWEKRVFGMFFGLFAGGTFNLDECRHSQERMGNRVRTIFRVRRRAPASVKGPK